MKQYKLEELHKGLEVDTQSLKDILVGIQILLGHLRSYRDGSIIY